jgi:AcrR family transcriptional regulator
MRSQLRETPRVTQKSPSARRSTTRAVGGHDTRARIIAAATKEFAEHGLSGARIDTIAAGLRTSKRTIYYHFDSKENLYREVLLNYYEVLRNAIPPLDIDGIPATEALTKFTHFIVDHHYRHDEDARLLILENLARGRHPDPASLQNPIGPAIVDVLRRIRERGVAEGSMRGDLDATDLYMSIMALSFFNISNRYTFAAAFGRDMESGEARAARKASITEMILRHAAQRPR